MNAVLVQCKKLVVAPTISVVVHSLVIQSCAITYWDNEQVIIIIGTSMLSHQSYDQLN